MILGLNIRQLETQTLQFRGELPAEAAGLESVDDLVRPVGPVEYEFTAERQERGILLQGSLAVDFRCECARCLGEFLFPIRLEPWACLLSLEGEDRVEVRNDAVDLTPYLREDIVLALPQRPLCKPDCCGLPARPEASSRDQKAVNSTGAVSSAWDELDKLRL